MSEEIRVSVFKIDGRDAFYMQYRHPETGRKVKRSTGKSVRRDAERAAARWEKELLEGRDDRLGRMAWDDFRRRYEDEVVASFAESSEKKIASVLNKLEEHSHPAKLGSVTTDMLTRFQKTLRDEGLSENTIKGHLAHIRAALAWAFAVGLLAAMPRIPKTQRAKATRVMKGRPITGEEFDRMIAKVQAALCEATEPDRRKSYKRWTAEARDEVQKRRANLAVDAAPSWARLVRGLWLSGLRLSESLELHWTDPEKLRVDLSCRHPMLRIPAEMEKGHKDRLLPMAPEFAEYLLETPLAQRVGYVFDPKPIRADKQGDRLGEQQVGRIITAIGRLANVKVNERTKGDVVKVKYASAHDMRRSFGERWASRVMPQVLMELMRHESMDTTLRYYVGRNAQQTASVLWDAHKLAVGANSGASEQKHQETKTPATTEVVTGE